MTNNQLPLKTVPVSAVALINPHGKILLAQRPAGKMMAGLWEFPGGKIHEGETPEVALVRELKEELGIGITATDLELFTSITHDYDTFRLHMHLFLCRRWKGEVAPQEGQQIMWKRADEMAAIPMPPADVPLVEKLISDFHKHK